METDSDSLDNLNLSPLPPEKGESHDQQETTPSPQKRACMERKQDTDPPILELLTPSPQKRTCTERNQETDDSLSPTPPPHKKAYMEGTPQPHFDTLADTSNTPVQYKRYNTRGLQVTYKQDTDPPILELLTPSPQKRTCTERNQETDDSLSPTPPPHKYKLVEGTPQHIKPHFDTLADGLGTSSTPVQYRRYNTRGLQVTYKQESQLDSSLSTLDLGEQQDLSYCFTPQNIHCEPEDNLCFLNTRQIHQMLEKMRTRTSCKTPHCGGNLVVVSVMKEGMGGVARITLNCNGCQEQKLTFDTCRIEKGDKLGSETEKAIHVAFIASGCMYATLDKVLAQSLGIPVSYHRFLDTIRLMYPVVRDMVDDMCKEARAEMEKKDPKELGSWKRAVTVSDGCWMTRGRHSKNSTYSIRNYLNGALLYRKHLCQKGRDKEIKEDLYEGTSAGAEGEACGLLFNQARDEHMELAIQWQDGDSKTASIVAGIFPEAEIMLCRGHEGKNHLKRLKELAKMKKFSASWISNNQQYIPNSGKLSEKACGCENNHSPNCGCIKEIFAKNSRNMLSYILSQATSPEEYAEQVRTLYKHGIDDHTDCIYHSPTVCSCGECRDKNNHTCEGEKYVKRHALTCKFHRLAYLAEIEFRASRAYKLIHRELGAGETHLVEASHSVLIRFRSKDISLERLHYHVSTDLGLLQANLTYMRKKRGSEYHWLPELYKRLGLPLHNGVERQVIAVANRRDKALTKAKEERSKRKRIERKIRRTLDGAKRIAWSAARGKGKHTYGVPEKKGSKTCKCGSNLHQRTTHADCPLNKKNSNPQAPERILTPDLNSESCKCGSKHHKRTTHKDCPLNQKNCRQEPVSSPDTEKQTQVDCPFNKENRSNSQEPERITIYHDSCDSLDSSSDVINIYDNDNFEDECTCPNPKAHKRDCKLNFRNVGRKLFPSFKLGDSVVIHYPKMDQKHLDCRIAQVSGQKYTLFCQQGTLKRRFALGELEPAEKCHEFSLNEWRQAPIIDTRQLTKENLSDCCCQRAQPHYVVVEEHKEDERGQQAAEITTPLYTLSKSDMDTVRTPTGWLNDNVISASQQILAQQFPRVEGLEPPAIQQIPAFTIHTGEFVQVINIDNLHWCVVSTVGCLSGDVKVFDTKFRKLRSSTRQIIVSLLWTDSASLHIQMMDVNLQTNSYDCGPLCIAVAYDLCSGNNPLEVVYDETKLRKHLETSLVNCHFASRFPIERTRLSVGVKSTIDIPLYCTCRLPETEDPDNHYAKCKSCEGWFHQKCQDIPDKVFEKNSRVDWFCIQCKTNQLN